MKKNQANKKQLEIIEATITSWLEVGVHPVTIGVALNNAFFHGAALEKGNIACSSSGLKNIYAGIEVFFAAAQKMHQE